MVVNISTNVPLSYERASSAQEGHRNIIHPWKHMAWWPPLKAHVFCAGYTGRHLPLCCRMACSAGLCGHEQKSPHRQWPLRRVGLPLDPNSTLELGVQIQPERQMYVNGKVSLEWYYFVLYLEHNGKTKNRANSYWGKLCDNRDQTQGFREVR